MCTLLERFTRRGVALVSVAESLDTGSAAGRLVLNIMTAVSQWEREAIGERTRDAMSHKRTNGERVGNIQFGYRLGTDGKHVEPDAAGQAVLLEGTEKKAAGTAGKVQPASGRTAADAAKHVRPVESASAGAATGGAQIPEPVFTATCGAPAGHAARIEKHGAAGFSGPNRN